MGQPFQHQGDRQHGPAIKDVRFQRRDTRPNPAGVPGQRAALIRGSEARGTPSLSRTSLGVEPRGWPRTTTSTARSPEQRISCKRYSAPASRGITPTPSCSNRRLSAGVTMPPSHGPQLTERTRQAGSCRPVAGPACSAPRSPWRSRPDRPGPAWPWSRRTAPARRRSSSRPRPARSGGHRPWWSKRAGIARRSCLRYASPPGRRRRGSDRGWVPVRAWKGARSS